MTIDNATWYQGLDGGWYLTARQDLAPLDMVGYPGRHRRPDHATRAADMGYQARHSF